jgi:hypothetical protein
MAGCTCAGDEHVLAICALALTWRGEESGIGFAGETVGGSRSGAGETRGVAGETGTCVRDHVRLLRHTGALTRGGSGGRESGTGLAEDTVRLGRSSAGPTAGTAGETGGGGGVEVEARVAGTGVGTGTGESAVGGAGETGRGRGGRRVETGGAVGMAGGGEGSGVGVVVAEMGIRIGRRS